MNRRGKRIRINLRVTRLSTSPADLSKVFKIPSSFVVFIHHLRYSRLNQHIWFCLWIRKKIDEYSLTAWHHETLYEVDICQKMERIFLEQFFNSKKNQTFISLQKKSYTNEESKAKWHQKLACCVESGEEIP